jgi:alpha-D-ribose 1-methylphosphonate 5-triphosphate synthase subunit PhnL
VHDEDVRERIADTVIDMAQFMPRVTVAA